MLTSSIERSGGRVVSDCSHRPGCVDRAHEAIAVVAGPEPDELIGDAAMSGTSAIRDRKRSGSGTPVRGMKLKKKMLITTTISRKVVPHRVWAVRTDRPPPGSAAAGPRAR